MEDRGHDTTMFLRDGPDQFEGLVMTIVVLVLSGAARRAVFGAR